MSILIFFLYSGSVPIYMRRGTLLKRGVKRSEDLLRFVRVVGPTDRTRGPVSGAHVRPGLADALKRSAERIQAGRNELGPIPTGTQGETNRWWSVAASRPLRKAWTEADLG